MKKFLTILALSLSFSQVIKAHTVVHPYPITLPELRELADNHCGVRGLGRADNIGYAHCHFPPLSSTKYCFEVKFTCAHW